MFALKRWKDTGREADPSGETRTYRPASHVMDATREGRSVLLDLHHERYYGLDEVGTSIWSCVREGLSVPQIVDRLEEEYEVPRTKLEADTSTFLSLLARSRLVEGT